MTYGRQIAITLGALLLAFTLAVLAPSHTVNAQNACSAGCKAAYGACYKSSQDRARCQAQLQRCLEGCIRSKR